MSKVKILAFAAHPDDIELSCSGTLIKHIEMGDHVAIIDLTRGELGTRGTAQTRESELLEASKIMRISYRENLGFKDGFFKNNEEHQLGVITMIRKYQPDIVLCNAINDRHPDHGRASSLVSDACFLSGLVKIQTFDKDKNNQEPWRPKSIYHYIQDRYIQPSFVVDISAFIDKKMESIKAFKTQFYNPNSIEPATYISNPAFLGSILNRAAEFGKTIGVDYAEGFTTERVIGINSLNTLI